MQRITPSPAASLPSSEEAASILNKTGAGQHSSVEAVKAGSKAEDPRAAANLNLGDTHLLICRLRREEADAAARAAAETSQSSRQLQM